MSFLCNTTHLQKCIGHAFIEQKLNYIHQNPCAGKYNLAATPEDYLHSSAKYYGTGEQGIFLLQAICNWRILI